MHHALKKSAKTDSAKKIDYWILTGLVATPALFQAALYQYVRGWRPEPGTAGTEFLGLAALPYVLGGALLALLALIITITPVCRSIPSRLRLFWVLLSATGVTIAIFLFKPA